MFYLVKINKGYRESFGKITILPVVVSSAIMAMAGMGDALLYAYLPTKGFDLGMSAVTIGVLLSANKFIRFFSNRWVAYFTKIWSLKSVLTIGVILAALTTFTYAIDPLIWVWILSRIGWGIAYSALRFSTLQYAGKTRSIGKSLGWGKSITEFGAILAYFVGPFLITSLDARTAFIILGFLTLGMLPLLYYLPNIYAKRQKMKAFVLKIPGITDCWIFLSSYVVEGLLVVGISEIIDFGNSSSDHLLVITAIYISIRRVLNILIAPVSGWMSDKFGFKKTFHGSCIILMIGLSCIALGFEVAGLLVSFVGAAINTTLVPILALNYTQEKNSFDSLTTLTTSRDLGSALGSLSGLYLLSNFEIHTIFILIVSILIFIWFKIFKTQRYE